MPPQHRQSQAPAWRLELGRGHFFCVVEVLEVGQYPATKPLHWSTRIQQLLNLLSMKITQRYRKQDGCEHIKNNDINVGVSFH
jgi:hypothetical protein